MIWPNDHPPPHVHIVRGDKTLAIVNISIEGRIVSIKENYSMKRQELASAVHVVAANNELFVQEWMKVHGES